MIDLLGLMLKADKHEDALGKILEYQAALPNTPLDIEGLCNAIPKVTVKRLTLDKKLSGCIQKRSESDYLIMVNSTHSETRQRFTMAHELAHFLLHRDDLGDDFPENMLLRGGLSNRKETEANQLAAEILMPHAKINDYLDGTPSESFTIRELAGVFGVSASAMSIRLGIPMDW